MKALVIGLVVLLLATAVVPVLAAQPGTMPAGSSGSPTWTVQAGNGFGALGGGFLPYGDCEDGGNCDG